MPRETIKDYFKTVEKADVHNHFHLGGSQMGLLKLYPHATIQFPKKYNGLSGMIDFIYGHLNKIMATGEDVTNFMKLSIESSIADNVTYLEASVDVNLTRFFNDKIDEVINEVKTLKETHKDHVDFRPDIGINKDLELKKAYNYTEAFIDSGLFYGIDLYGQEAEQNLNPFIDLFKLAEKNSLKTKVHIGEFSNAESIKETIIKLNPKEIQHGINAVQSDYVMDIILERNIRLNICPQSNWCLGAVKERKLHPIRQLFDKGITVTVNTDDLVLFNAYVSDELSSLVELGIFSFEEVETIRRNGFA